MIANLFEFWEHLRIAVQSLISNKMRAFLTVLGIIIGVAAIVGMVSFIHGLNTIFAEQISQLGARSVAVSKFPGIVTSNREWHNYNRRPDLEFHTGQRLQQRLENIADAFSFQQSLYSGIQYQKKQTLPLTILGVSPSYLEFQTIDVKYGRMFNIYDDNSKSPVAVLGADAAKTLFTNPQDAVGEKITVLGKKVRVVGIPQELGSIFGESRDSYVAMPYQTMRKMFGRKGRYQQLQFLVKVRDDLVFEEALDRIIHEMRILRGLELDEENDFELITEESLMTTFNNMTAIAFAVMIGISSIALVVGGIGIMNIMLVSVTERTREIGIRKAVGAARKDILRQFLIEALILCLAGGLIGLLLGVGAAFAMKHLTPLPAQPPWWSIVVGFGIPCLIGLFFGIYPAMKAAKLDPVECLHYE